MFCYNFVPSFCFEDVISSIFFSLYIIVDFKDYIYLLWVSTYFESCLILPTFSFNVSSSYSLLFKFLWAVVSAIELFFIWILSYCSSSPIFFLNFFFSSSSCSLDDNAYSNCFLCCFSEFNWSFKIETSWIRSFFASYSYSHFLFSFDNSFES